MSTQTFLSGFFLGLLLGTVLTYGALQVLSRQRIRCHKREIEELTEQFQELFRQIDRGKNKNR
ncbi:MAG: hypothetical protein KatS3mg131_1700 [Candidatus Tectimicrobiota bacterium]|nr:MAG: hypothetical protein KatS3mg131_1700 [Candidatus Tectomicrobia bacterium]